MNHKDSVVEWLLRVGVAFTFLYPPVSAWFNPYAWVGYFPTFVVDISPVSEVTLLHLFGIVEIAIGLWTLFGKKILVPAALATLSLLLIVVFNWTQMDVLFRDLPIALMALVLCVRHMDRNKDSAP